MGMISRQDPKDVLVAKERLWRVFLLIAIVWVLWTVRDQRWHVVWDNRVFLFRGLATSWLLALISITLGGVVAIPLVWARVYGPSGLRHVAVALIEIVRATPELMVVFWIFFAFPGLVGIAVSNWVAGTTALSIMAAAYLAEVFRGGLYSVPRMQWDAALSTGLSSRQSFMYVVLPQAVRNMVPALVAQLVMLFKATSLVYVIGVIEFFRAATIVNNSNYAPFVLYSTIAAGYFFCCWLLTFLVEKFEPRYSLVD